MFGKRIILLSALMIALCLTAPLIMASPNIIISDTSLYLQLGSDYSFNYGTRTDTSLTRAEIPINLKSSSSFWTTDSVLNMTVVIQYDQGSLDFISAAATSNWNGSFTVIDSASVGRVTLSFASGGKPLTSSYVQFATAYFSPLCLPDFSSMSLTVMQSERTYLVSKHTGNLFTPISGHCYAGGVTVDDSWFAYWTPYQTVSNARGRSIPIPVLAEGNHRYAGFDHVIRYNHSKLHFDSISFNSVWFIEDVDATRTDTIGVSTYTLTPKAEPTGDTLYRIWVTPQCSSSIMDTAKLAFPYGLSQHFDLCFAGIGAVFSGGTLSMRDSTEVKATLPSSTTVSRVDTSSVTYTIQLMNTLAVGKQSQYDPGVTIVFNDNSANLDATDYTVLDTNLGWEAVAPLQGDETAIYQNTVDTIPASPLTDRVALILKWDPAGFSPTWAGRYLKPHFDSTWNGYVTTAPSALCDYLIATPKRGTVDSVLVEMAQPGTTTVSGNGCIWQTVRIRNSNVIDSVRMIVTVPSNANLISSASLLTGISVTSLGGRRYAVAGNVAISASDNFTNLAKFRLEPINCMSGGQVISLSVDSCQNFSNITGLVQEFSAPFDSGVATSTFTCAMASCAIIYADRKENTDGGLPKEFALDQNYPNPFNPTTTINLALPVASEWHITIINIAGQVVDEFHGYGGPGVVSIEWNASAYASGVYLYRAEAGTFTQTKKMILLR